MTADRRISSGDKGSFIEKRQKKFLVNVLLGALATFTIGLLPLIKIIAPLGGGALAGYFQNTGMRDGAKIGGLVGAIGIVGLNVLAPPRFFGLLGGDIGGGFFLMAVILGLVIWIITSAFGGALGARLAENRYGSSRGRR